MVLIFRTRAEVGIYYNLNVHFFLMREIFRKAAKAQRKALLYTEAYLKKFTCESLAVIPGTINGPCSTIEGKTAGSFTQKPSTQQGRVRV